MRNGIEIRPNGVTVVKVIKEGYRGYRIKEDTNGVLWDYIHNARRYADNMVVDPVTGVKSFKFRSYHES